LEAATKDMVLVRGWQISDMVIVSAHILSIVVMVIPVIVIVLL
jgi:hypothetical protein